MSLSIVPSGSLVGFSPSTTQPSTLFVGLPTTSLSPACPLRFFDLLRFFFGGAAIAMLSSLEATVVSPTFASLISLASTASFLKPASTYVRFPLKFVIRVMFRGCLGRLQDRFRKYNELQK